MLSIRTNNATPCDRTRDGVMDATADGAAPHGSAANTLTTASQATHALGDATSGYAVADTSMPNEAMMPTSSGPSDRPRATNQSASQPPATTLTVPIVIVSVPCTLPACSYVQPNFRTSIVASQNAIA